MKQILHRLFEYQCLGQDEAYTVLQNIAQGKYNDAQVASPITTLLMRNISVEELYGFRDTLLEMRVPADLGGFTPVDIVGTGGDGKNIFNISTAVCFAVIGAGFPIVKHSNYGTISISGVSNVMEQHRVKFTSDADRLRCSIEKYSVVYLHVPLFSPALKTMAPIRRALVVRTFFNMLNLLINPVISQYQLLGVYNLPLFRLHTYIYQESATRLAVVHSLGRYDEVSLTDESRVTACGNEKIYTPGSFGFNRCGEVDFDGGNTPESIVKTSDAAMEGTATEAQKNVVAVNAAFATQVICPDKPIEKYIALACESPDSGKAEETLKKFVELNRQESYRPPRSIKDILSEIIANKCFEIDLQKRAIPSERPQEKLSDEIQPGYSMKQVLTSSSTGIVAEFKHRSPSKGWTYEDTRPEQVAPEYAISGAPALSVLTDEKFFGGNLKGICMARPLVNIPILRGDFIINEYQLYRAKVAGADAILLIAVVLGTEKYHVLIEKAHGPGLEVLLEAHTAKELPFIDKEIDMVGTSNRNLGTFFTGVENSFRLARQLPRDTVLVSGSGISDPQTVKHLRNTEFRGFLIGETFMRTGQPGKKLEESINESNPVTYPHDEFTTEQHRGYRVLTFKSTEIS